MQQKLVLCFGIVLSFCVSTLHAQTTYPVEWTDLVNLSVNADNSLTKTSAATSFSDAGAASYNTLEAGVDGWAEFVMGAVGNTYMVGLENRNLDESFGTGNDYRIYITVTGVVYLYESKVGRKQLFSAVPGDVFRVGRVGSTILYYRNGTQFNTGTTPVTGSMLVDATVANGTVPPVTCSFSYFRLGGSVTASRSDVSNGAASVTTFGGVPPFTYQWSDGGTTPAISGKSAGENYQVTVTDATGKTRTRNYPIGYKESWMNLSNCTVNANNSLSKIGTSATWNSTAASSNRLAAGTDGWIEFIIDNPVGSTYMIGLSDVTTGNGYALNLYSFYVQSTGQLLVMEGAAARGAVGYVHKGDMLRIVREGSMVKYYLNDQEVISASTTDPNKRLYARAAIFLGTTPIISTSFDLPSMIVQAKVSYTGYADVNGRIEVSVLGGKSPYTYSWSGLSNEHTATLTKPRGTYTVTITDAAGATKTRTYGIGYKPYYTDYSQVTEANGVLTRTGVAAWNAGANSANVLPRNTDGWIEFVADSAVNATNLYKIGFGTSFTTFGAGDFKNALYINSNNGSRLLYSTEAGTNTALGTWQVGDVFRIERKGLDMFYYKNDSLLRRVDADSTKDQWVKTVVNSGKSLRFGTSFDSRIFVTPTIKGTGYADGTGSISLDVKGGTAPYTYHWSTGEHTGTLTNKQRGNYTVTVTDAEGRHREMSYNLGYRMYYIDHYQANETDGVLTKTVAAGWNAGANSTNVLPALTDGWIEFVTDDVSTYMIGLGTNSSTFTESSFRNALVVSATAGSLTGAEGASNPALGVWLPGDVFRIAREGPAINYYRNGKLLRTVATDPNLILFVKTMLYSGSTPRVTTSFDSRFTVGALVKGTDRTDGTGSIELNARGGSTPYTYLWASGESDNAIGERSRGAYTVTVHDAEGRVLNRTYNLGYRLLYENLVLATQSDGVLTKQAGISANWNAGANGFNVLPAKTDGWIEFVSGESNYCGIGFLFSTASYAINSQRHGLTLNNLTNLKYYHDQNVTASSALIPAGTWVPGDVFRVSREGDSVRYYRNNVPFRSVVTDRKLELLVKVTLAAGSVPLINTSFDDPLYVSATVRGLDTFDGRANITLKPLSGDSPYTYTWSTGAQGDTISNKVKGTYTATITDADNRVRKYTYQLNYNAYWTNLTGVTDNDHVLTRTSTTAAWDAGAISSNQLAAGADGWIEFSPALESLNSTYIIGFSSTTNRVLNTNGFTNGIRLDYPYRHLYSYAGSQPILIGSWRPGDVFRIERVGNKAYYYQNGMPIDTFQIITGALNVKAVINAGSIPHISTSLWVPASEGVVPDATEFKALKELYDSLGGAAWLNKTNWPTGTWPGAVTNDLFGTWFGVTVQGGDIVGLSLPTNNLIGKIPASIGTLAKLTSIDFHGNGINGNLTGSVGDLGSLTSLLLGSNQISGAIPAQLSKLGGLQQLSLGDNKLSGKIPTVLGGLTNLQLLDLQKNQLSGEIPGLLSGLTSLKTLSLQSNRFTGRVPQELAALGQLISLSVQNNELTGLSNLSGAANRANLALDVSQNRISFDDLEPNMTGVNTTVFQSFTRSPQKPFNEVTQLKIPEHATLKIQARNPGVHGAIVWEWRPVGSSTWSSVTNEDGTQRTLKLSNFPVSKAGLYRYKMTNTWFPGVTLESDPITVEVGGYLVQWMDVTPGVTANADGTLTRSSGTGWNAGANSYNLLRAAATGSLEFVVDNTTKNYIVGFSTHNGEFATESVDYGFSLQADQSLLIWQSSTSGVKTGTWKLGDRLKIGRNATSIIYYKNDTLISTVAADTARELRVKMALYSGSAPVIVTSFDVQLLLTATITPTKSYGVAGAITITPAGGSGSYTYDWSSGEKTPSISAKGTGNYRVTVKDDLQRSISIPYDLGQQVVWTDLTNVSGSGSQLTKGGNEAWDGGANSTMVLHSGDNGWVEFVVGDNTSTYMVGFASPSGIFNTAAMAYGIAIQEGQRVYAWESAFAGTSIGNWQRGDVFKVARIDNMIYYYRNGKQLRSVAAGAAAGDMIIKTIMYTGKVGLVQGLLPGNEYNPPALDDATEDYTLPDEVKITRDGRMPLPPREQQGFLSAVNQGDIKPLFPTCETGNFIAGFQLYYDLGDRNTSADWSAYVQVTLFYNEVELWTKPLRLKMKDQTFIATAFYDSLISCDGNYYYHIDYKTIEGPVPQDNIFFKILLYKNRDEVFNPASTLTLNCIDSGAGHEKTVSWNYTGKAAIEYDIEWVFIDKYEGFPDNGTAQDAFLFKEPARVTTAMPYYKHQVYYPTGKIWYRARAVGINPQNPGRHIPGIWFYGTSCSSIAVDNHEPGLNWQEQTVFAEEGKYKKVMNYFDGSLRQLQVQTNLSSENVTLVGEGMYDYEGRSTVNVMAVPAADATLLYKPAFNTFQSVDAVVTSNAPSGVSKFHYDNYRLTNSILSNQSGASQYYSANNASNSIHRDYIPEGKGYVYSQTEYLNDGTVRPTRQSAVGEEFRLDGDHATRYSYGSATDEELVRLFGSNVGYASYYKKDLVVDPNGQVSVMYVDQQKHIIATALAGNSPKNVEALQSYKDIDTTQLTTINIGRKNTVTDGLSYTSHKILNVTPETKYTFDYDLSAYASSEVVGCKRCVFDLEITVSDPDGALLNLSAAAGNESADPYRYVRRSIKADSCTLPEQVSVQFQLILHEIGDYTVTKSLVSHDLTYDEMKALVEDDVTVKQTIQELQRIYTPDPEDCAICHTLECPEADSIIDQTIEEIATEDCENMHRMMERYYQDKHDAEYRAAHNNEPDPEIYEVPEDTLRKHPDYCQYVLCGRDKPSDVFEKQLVRVLDWETAEQRGYANLIDYDPFFNDPSLSGHGSKGNMQAQLASIKLATINNRVYQGPLNDVVDPNNKNYYVDAAGNPDQNGRHLLYLDIMSKRDQYTEAEYNAKVSSQRWTMYRSFYLEQKRLIKISLYGDEHCTKAVDALKAGYEVPDNPDDIPAWGEQHGVSGPVTDVDLNMSVHTLKIACDTEFNEAETQTLKTNLEAYFNGNPKNFFRMILKQDLGINPNLIAINNVLLGHGCNLDSIAHVDPLDCKTTVTIHTGGTGGEATYSDNLIKNPDLNRNPGCGNEITSDCYDGWDKVFPFGEGPTTSASGKTIFMSAKGSCWTPQTVRGSFTSALVPGKQYRLCFQYWAYNQGEYPGVVDELSIGLSRSEEFFGPDDGCGSPVIVEPDPVTIQGQTESSNFLWYGENLIHDANANSDYVDVCVTFTAQEASTYFYAWPYSRSGLEAVVIKDLKIQEVLSDGGNGGGGEDVDVCLEYNQENPTLAGFGFKVDWDLEIQRCMENAVRQDSALLAYATEKVYAEAISKFYNAYRTDCMEKVREGFEYSYLNKEYHYTLYYYNQAGLLVQTVPPKGVNFLTAQQSTSVLAGNTIFPEHRLVTLYKYNSVNQMLWNKTPDSGESQIWYDKKMQVRLFQDSQQSKDNNYSYTKYDNQGRIVESGEMNTLENMDILTDKIQSDEFPMASSYNLNDVVCTHYDISISLPGNDFVQQNLRTRVSYIESFEKSSVDTISTYYSYDIHGNVKSLLKHLPGLNNKRIDYVYDLINSKVNYLMYEYGKADEFIHRYTYDADNRIRQVYTSSDGFIWDKDAESQYYQHGPLARLEIGEYRLQGLDYYYTLRGWTKGVNGFVDPGRDGIGGSFVPMDEFSYNLGYYDGDYSGVGLTTTNEYYQAPMRQYSNFMKNQGLFNGNIAWAATDLKKIGQMRGGRNDAVQGMLYKYDQLNRILQSRSLTNFGGAVGFDDRSTEPSSYDENFNYDANGNLLLLDRRDEAAVVVNNFNYDYYRNTNRLKQLLPVLCDTVYNGVVVNSDNKVYRNITIGGNSYVQQGADVTLKAMENIYIDSSGFDVEKNAAFRAYVLPDDEGVYLYDATGKLIWDQEEGVKIKWTLYDRISEIAKHDTTIVRYRYDSDGNRVAKKFMNNDTSYVAHYVRDANGNVMAIYENGRLIEQSIYGSDRIGMYRLGRRAGHRTMGMKSYELNNHLGNVSAVITDNIYLSADSSWVKVTNVDDYYSFGLTMKGRHFSDSTYRYGFNGKEKDNDGVFLDTVYDYGSRMYNPTIGRWFSPDPQAHKYASEGPYDFSANNPIIYVDPDGQDWFYYRAKGSGGADWHWHDGTQIQIQTDTDIDNKPVFTTVQGQAAVIAFKGSRRERFGPKNGNAKNLFGEGAITAEITVYGPGGIDDVASYTGFSLTSDEPNLTPIDEGIYSVKRRKSVGTGKLPKHYMVYEDNRDNIRTMDGVTNCNADNQKRSNGEGYKGSIFIHRTNNDGGAGGHVSTGCLLISPTDWDNFNEQLKPLGNLMDSERGARQALLILTREHSNNNPKMKYPAEKTAGPRYKNDAYYELSGRKRRK